MKNISLTINPNSVTSLAPPPMPAPPFNQPAPPMPKQVYSVSASAQFDDEDEALVFVNFIISFKSKVIEVK